MTSLRRDVIYGKVSNWESFPLDNVCQIDWREGNESLCNDSFVSLNGIAKQNEQGKNSPQVSRGL